MNSKIRFTTETKEKWGVQPSHASILYDVQSWDMLGDIIAAEGSDMTIGELLAFIAVAADLLKNEPMENEIDEDDIDLE